MAKVDGSPVQATFRRSLYRWSVAGIPGIFLLLSLSSLAQSRQTWEADSFYPYDSPQAIGLEASAGVLAMASGVLVVRILRMGLFATEDGLLIRNLTRSHHLRWAEIDRFERPAPFGAWRNTGLRVCLKDGEGDPLSGPVAMRPGVG